MKKKSILIIIKRWVKGETILEEETPVEIKIEGFQREENVVDLEEKNKIEEEHEEEEIVGSTTMGALVEPECVLKQKDVIQLQEVVQKIPVSAHVIKYAIKLVRAARPEYDDSPKYTKDYVSTGAGPRAGQYLVLGAKARAVLEGRIHVSCRDIRSAAIPVLRHRIITNFAADSEGLTTMDIVNHLLEEVDEPGEEAYSDD